MKVIAGCHRSDGFAADQDSLPWTKMEFMGPFPEQFGKRP